jgi:hypothetical protein
LSISQELAFRALDSSSPRRSAEVSPTGADFFFFLVSFHVLLFNPPSSLAVSRACLH